MTTTNEQQPHVETPTTPPSSTWRTPIGTLSARWDGSNLITDPRRKHPMLAIVLSAMPGLGQIYVGYYQQGITLAIVAGTLLTLVAGRSFGLRDFEPLLVMSTMFTWLYSAVDAGRRASLYNQALLGLRPMDLPENQRTPEWRGSLVGGACLVGFGTVLFFHTMFGLPMEWVTRWWPLALVLVGAWLVYASIQSRATDAVSSNPAGDTDRFES